MRANLGETIDTQLCPTVRARPASFCADTGYHLGEAKQIEVQCTRGQVINFTERMYPSAGRSLATIMKENIRQRPLADFQFENYLARTLPYANE